MTQGKQQKKANDDLGVAVDRLRRSSDVTAEMTPEEHTDDRAQAQAQAGAVDDGQRDLHVVAHGGLDGGRGHLGGLSMADFARCLLKKYGPWLNGSTLWLHVCDLGRVLDQFFEALQEADKERTITDLTVYAPLNLVIVSNHGVPHVYFEPVADSTALDALVAKHDADYESLVENKVKFGATGKYWAGMQLAGGRVTVLGTQAVEETVQEKFDSASMEV